MNRRRVNETESSRTDPNEWQESINCELAAVEPVADEDEPCGGRIDALWTRTVTSAAVSSNTAIWCWLWCDDNDGWSCDFYVLCSIMRVCICDNFYVGMRILLRQVLCSLASIHPSNPFQTHCTRFLPSPHFSMPALCFLVSKYKIFHHIKSLIRFQKWNVYKSIWIRICDRQAKCNNNNIFWKKLVSELEIFRFVLKIFEIFVGNFFQRSHRVFRCKWRCISTLISHRGGS